MPDVRHPGDVHFFNPDTKIRVDKQTNWDKGLEWYKSFFVEYKNEKAVGEKTASYLTDERAPELISQTLGNEVKLIVILRNPIYRAFSNYLYFSGQIPEKIKFLEACQSKEYQRLELLESGNYFKHLTRYFKHFSKDQFLFIIYDDLLANPLKTIQHTFQFLEVDPEFIPEHNEKFYNEAIGGSFLSKILKKTGGQLKHKYPKIYSVIEKTAIGNFAFKLLSTSSSGDVSKKKDYYYGFTKRLSIFSPRTYKHGITADTARWSAYAL